MNAYSYIKIYDDIARYIEFILQYDNIYRRHLTINRKNMTIYRRWFDDIYKRYMTIWRY